MASINNYVKFTVASQTNKEGGYKNTVFFAPVDTFASIKVPTATPTALGDKVKITTAHTFKTDEGFISLLCKKHSVTITAEPTGDEGAQSMVYTSKFILLGDSASTQQMLQEMLNLDCIFLLKDQDCLNATDYIQLGDECLTPTAKVSFDGKTTLEGLKEYTVELKVKGKKFFYSGTLTEKP